MSIVITGLAAWGIFSCGVLFGVLLAGVCVVARRADDPYQEWMNDK